MADNDPLIEKNRYLFYNRPTANGYYEAADSNKTNPTNGTDPATKDTADSGWWGLDSTQILIIFLTVVFAVLVIFLLIYYYCIRGMKQNSVTNRLTQKSASGSIGEDKSRNIFAHPDKQLAVDQSTRANPNSPASASDADTIPQPASLANLPQVSSNQSTAPPQAPASQSQSNRGGNQSAAAPAVSMAPASGSASLKHSDQQQQQPPPPQAGRQKSNSGKRTRQQHDEHHGVLGALAGLRDTLKETEQHK